MCLSEMPYRIEFNWSRREEISFCLRVPSQSTVCLYVTGTTAQSCSVRVVLGNLCWHLASLAGADVSCIPGDYSGLVSCFHRMLKVCIPHLTHSLHADVAHVAYLIISPMAIAYSMGWIIKSVCVCQFICPSASTLCLLYTSDAADE